jgi:hypothetical protein
MGKVDYLKQWKAILNVIKASVDMLVKRKLVP